MHDFHFPNILEIQCSFHEAYVGKRNSTLTLMAKLPNIGTAFLNPEDQRNVDAEELGPSESNFYKVRVE